MGGSKLYKMDGGFAKQTFEQTGIVNGIKVVRGIGRDNSNPPLYSNTPYTMYASINKTTGNINQVSVYGGKGGRAKIKDIDTEHEHKNKYMGKVKQVFAINQIHVQEYKDGQRYKNARKPSKKERRLLMLARNKRGTNS